MSASPDQSSALDDRRASAGSTAAGQFSDFVNSRINFERLPSERYDLQDFKLDRVRELLRRLSDPQFQIPAVHIAGTKGKGSTAAMTAAMLTAAGYRVGLFTSPHIDSLGERMTVNGQLPTDAQMLEMLEAARLVVDEMDRLGPSMRCTFFECITAMAWTHFRLQQVDLVVLEVGLGGRLDATNICSPLVTVITSISRDHERLLGSTLAEIAAEKAGIIKPGAPVISGVTSPEPRDVIREFARANESPLYELGRDLQWSTAAESTATAGAESGPSRNADEPFPPVTIETSTPWSRRVVRVPLPGRHQADNTLLAISACDLLNERGFPVNPPAIESGLETLKWPLRIEVLRRRPLTIVDAAHNDGSVESLIATLRSLHCRKRILIFGTSRDKDTHGLLARLNGHFDHVILTRFVSNPRSVPLDGLQEAAARRLSIPFDLAESPTAAWLMALSRAHEEDLICAAGSFFLAAEMRNIVLAENSASPPSAQVVRA